MAIQGKPNQNAIDARAKENAKKAKEMSEGIQYAIILAAPSVHNGAFWGFTTMESIKGHLAVIKESAPNLTARKIGNSCLVEVNPTYLINGIQTIDPEAITQADIDKIQQAKAEAHVAFRKYLLKQAKQVIKTGKPFSGIVGIYCTNDVTTISYKGVNYPAFRLNMQDTLIYLHECRYMIQVGGQFVSPQAAMSAQGNALWDSLVVSPTKTGAFMTISSTMNAAQVKAMEESMKQQTPKR